MGTPSCGADGHGSEPCLPQARPDCGVSRAGRDPGHLCWEPSWRRDGERGLLHWKRRGRLGRPGGRAQPSPCFVKLKVNASTVLFQGDTLHSFEMPPDLSWLLAQASVTTWHRGHSCVWQWRPDVARSRSVWTPSSWLSLLRHRLSAYADDAREIAPPAIAGLHGCARPGVWGGRKRSGGSPAPVPGGTQGTLSSSSHQPWSLVSSWRTGCPAVSKTVGPAPAALAMPTVGTMEGVRGSREWMHVCRQGAQQGWGAG